MDSQFLIPITISNIYCSVGSVKTAIRFISVRFVKSRQKFVTRTDETLDDTNITDVLCKIDKDFLIFIFPLAFNLKEKGHL